MTFLRWLFAKVLRHDPQRLKAPWRSGSFYVYKIKRDRDRVAVYCVVPRQQQNPLFFDSWPSTHEFVCEVSDCPECAVVIDEEQPWVQP